MGASDDIAEDAAIDEEPMSIADDDAIGCIDEAIEDAAPPETT
jgi:hypothetical protein